MEEELQLTEPTKGFENIKKLDKEGIEYWEARELVVLLGYEWRYFESVIEKSKESALNSGQDHKNHFVVNNKMVKTGSGAMRKVSDWKLSRYACYLIAQNGNPKIIAISNAQTYFAIQTRKQEIFQNLPDTEKRLLVRKEMIGENKKLMDTAKKAGVSRFGTFNDAGYIGLYGMTSKEILKYKNITGKDKLLDRAGSTELAANLFRVTQTEEKLRKDKVQEESKAINAHQMVGGKVRQTIKDIGGTTPENLPPEKHIKEVEKELKSLGTYDETIKKSLN